MTFLSGALKAACGCDDPALTSGLISLEEALVRVNASVHPLDASETVSLLDARGRVLSAPLCAGADMPRFDHSAMDGYALNSDALRGDGPWSLPVVGRVAAGEAAPLHAAATGTWRIFTGAPIPPGCDCVVMQEQVERRGDTIWLRTRPKPLDNIRTKGEEHRRGDCILPAGTFLSPRAIAACAAAGQGTVKVQRPVRVTLLVTGTEIQAPGSPDLQAGHIWDVNTPLLQAFLSRPSVELLDVIHISDNAPATRAALARAARNSDLIVTTGGVSVGEEDHVSAALYTLGGQMHFAGVAMKPGKPVSLGSIGNSVWLGLPGNPGAALVTWTVVGEPVLNRLSGRHTPVVQRRVVLSEQISRKPGRCEIRAARIIGADELGRDVAACPAHVNSGQVTALALCDGFMVFPADAAQLPKGALVEYLPFCNQ